MMAKAIVGSSFFFFNDTATTEIYTLSLHDALPIYRPRPHGQGFPDVPDQLLAPFVHADPRHRRVIGLVVEDRKSTRLNSSHANISYAVFCLKKNKTQFRTTPPLTPLHGHTPSSFRC